MTAYGSIEKLISGGQTGADSAIITVGQYLGIPTGGFVPKGWKTESGPRPELETLGFVESDSENYSVRTRLNVEQADATAVFATNELSPGTEQTIRFAVAARKPYRVIDPFAADAVVLLVKWLGEHTPAVLNVAGNRESVSPGIRERTAAVLEAALREVAGD